MSKQLPVIFSLQPHPLFDLLVKKLPADSGELHTRHFPDGESYLRIKTDVKNRHCIILADLSHPDKKYLSLIFLAATLRELGASRVGLIAPYLSYMRQDRRFVEGEAVTSRIFAAELSRSIDWLLTVDPHLHRYHALDEIYQVPSCVVQGAPALAHWLQDQENIFLVGPDSESEQWVSEISKNCGHAYVIGSKQRRGDRDVTVTLPDISHWQGKTAVIIDDVISSGQTIVQCIAALQANEVHNIWCAAIHGIFADHSDQILRQQGLQKLVTTNTIPHASNAIDISGLLLEPIRQLCNTWSVIN